MFRPYQRIACADLSEMAQDAVVVRLWARRGLATRKERKSPGLDEHEDVPLIRVITHVPEDLLARRRADPLFERPPQHLRVPDGITPKENHDQNEGDGPAASTQPALNLDQARAPVEHAKRDYGDQIALVVEGPDKQRRDIENEEDLESGNAPAAAPQQSDQRQAQRSCAQEELHEPLVALPETPELVPVDLQVAQDDAKVKL